MKSLTQAGLALGFLVFVLTSIPSCGHLFWKRRRTIPVTVTVVDTLPTRHGWLEVNSKPAGFVMLFDEKFKYLGTEPLTTPALIPLPPGTYDLKLKRIGYLDWWRMVDVAPDETTSILVIFRTPWSEETLRRQEKISLIAGAALFFLIIGTGWILRNKH